MTQTFYQCPECGSRAVYLDATIDAHYNPNTDEGWTDDDDVHCDNMNGLIQCQDCGEAEDHGGEWQREEPSPHTPEKTPENRLSLATRHANHLGLDDLRALAEAALEIQYKQDQDYFESSWENYGPEGEMLP